MSNILVIDDDKELTELLKEFLSNYNFNVSITHNPSRGIELATAGNADLVILDIMMPEIDGFKVLRKIRAVSNIPVIMLTARGKVEDRIVGLELGADDYLGKPFEPKELLARIQSILRRVKEQNTLIDIIEFENLKVNKIKQEVLLDGEPLHLSTSEMEALILFVDNSNQVLDREFLVENLRGIKWQTYDRSVDVLVSRLRNKLGETPTKTRFIKTIHGVGYRFIGIKKS